MADIAYDLKNDSIDTIPIMGRDAAGDLVPLPAGTTPTVVNADPVSLNAVVTGSNLVMNALVWPVAANGIRVEIDDGSLTPQVMIVTIVDDIAPVSVGLDLANVTHASQAVPPAAVTPTPTPTPAPGP
jgi:hypothetical protein